MLPDYAPVIYLAKEFGTRDIELLTSLGAEVRSEQIHWPSNKMFWRFLIFFDESAERVLIRDCDSDLLERDVVAIREWEASKSAFHIMRDHPLHFVPILGGMWGAMADEARKIFDKRDFYTYPDAKGEDQNFLRTIYPQIISSSLVHDSIFRYEKKSRNFPTPRIQYEYIGEVLNVDGEPLSPESRDMLKEFENSKAKRLILRLRFLKFMRTIRTSKERK